MRWSFHCTVAVTEITGSETFLHLTHGTDRWVGLVHGVHDLAPGTAGVGLARSGACLSLRRRTARWRRRPPMRWPPEGNGHGTDHARNSRIPTFPIRRGEQDFALKEMDHVWEDGGAYALLGPSGCGKTTLLNIISGLVHPSQGRILFDERDVTDRADGRAQHRAGVPVPGGLRHDDACATTWPSRCATAAWMQAYIAGRVRPDREDDRHGGRAGPQGARADGRRQAEDQRSAAAWCART